MGTFGICHNLKRTTHININKKVLAFFYIADNPRLPQLQDQDQVQVHVSDFNLYIFHDSGSYIDSSGTQVYFECHATYMQ